MDNVSDAKLDVLLILIDILANSYPEADFDEWARGLVLREDLGSSSLGNHVGLLHQFQSSDTIIATQCNVADWWLFLFPDGAEFDALSEEPVHALFGLVMSNRQRSLEIDLLGRLGDLLRRIDAEENTHRFWKRLARQRPARIARQLNQRFPAC